ncbi:MAG TPA: PEP-CTERM sorting domain-containing protein, partial [Phycisphaerae bacterium]|nr:PEP-CTERM sorting domain-containing protein [Phycisphaerae bacterium]
YMFTDVLISEYGDYGIFDEGMVAVTGSLFVTRLNDEFKVLSDDLVSDPPSPIDSGHGTWTGEVGIDLSAQFPVWTRLKLVLDDNLIALSAPGSISFIEKKVLGAGLSITIIPEPASLILLLGGVALIRRYR